MKKTVTFWILRASLHWSRKLWRKKNCGSAFPEFDPYEGSCKFQGCIHDREPGCAVKEAVEDGKISKERYESYISFFRELKERERRRYS